MKQEEELERNIKTQSYKKLINYVEEITKTDYFLEFIKDLRKNYNIPRNGFKRAVHTLEINGKKVKLHDSGASPKWIYYRDGKTIEEIDKKLMEICKKFHLHFWDWYEVFKEYLFYNRSPMMAMYHTLSYNLCRLSDVLEEKRTYKEDIENGDTYEGSFEEADDLAYPLAIRFSEYASQRDIIDYIKKFYPLIKEYQETYKNQDKNIKLGRVKTKDREIQRRNDFIYKNRQLPLKVISKLVSEKFDGKLDIDQGAIGKIISLEKKRRKEV